MAARMLPCGCQDNNAVAGRSPSEAALQSARPRRRETGVKPFFSQHRRFQMRRRVGALLGLSAALSLPVLGIARAFSNGLLATSEDSQWQVVSDHEQRFIQALRMGSASEADDASC
jgi:hypothetical protein